MLVRKKVGHIKCSFMNVTGVNYSRCASSVYAYSIKRKHMYSISNSRVILLDCFPDKETRTCCSCSLSIMINSQARLIPSSRIWRACASLYIYMVLAIARQMEELCKVARRVLRTWHNNVRNFPAFSFGGLTGRFGLANFNLAIHKWCTIKWASRLHT